MIKKPSTDKKNKKKVAIPKTVQQSIPYSAVYKNGIVEIAPDEYARIYILKDVNFRTASDEDQDMLFQRFGELLNTLSDSRIAFSCMNRTMSENEFSENHLLAMTDDKLNQYREETNNIMLGHLRDGNSIVSDKYVTLTTTAEDVEIASAYFDRMAGTITEAFRSVGGAEARPLNFEEVISVIYRAYHPFDCDMPIVEFDSMMKQGITSKDIVAPSSIKINKDDMILDDTYSCTLFTAVFPASLSTEFIANLNDAPFHLMTGVHMEAVQQEKAVKMVRNQITNISANIQEQQKRASRKGYSGDLISPDLAAAREEAMSLLNSVTNKNQRLFMTSVVITIFASTKDELEQYVKTVQMIGQKHMCTLKKLSCQQEAGFAAAMPIGLNRLAVNRLLTTETAALFIPFSSVELDHKHGIYYGLNSVSGSMILFNRLQSKNANGVILGTSGSGKSFSAKREIMSVILGTDADVYVIDPDREYASLAQMLGGEVIRIAAGAKTYINPLDMDINYADDDDPVTLKSNYLCSICEVAIGGRYGLDPIQKSVIDRCVRMIYAPYIEYMRQHPELTSDSTKAPTLLDFYKALLAQEEAEAQNLALELERYCAGSMDTFAHPTNVNTKARFIVYDIKDIGPGLHELGLHVCLNDIWNRTIANKSKKKRTWFYLDEFYLLTRTTASAQFLQEIFKRARKWGGVPTGITQDVEDLLANQECRGILNNCEFVMMLNQSPIGRSELSTMYNISPSLQRYITNAGVGHGLLRTGDTLVPFTDEYPRDTASFAAMTTTME